MITARTLAREHGEPAFLTGLALRSKVGANTLAECVNFTKIMDLKQEIRDFSYGTSSGDKKYL